mgnify:CR=1 FL=1
MLLEEFKHKVKSYQKNHNVKYSEALNIIAKENGYKNYNAYLASIKKKKKNIFSKVSQFISLRTSPKMIILLPERDIVEQKEVNTDDIFSIEDPIEYFDFNVDQNMLLKDNKKIISDIKLLKDYFGYSDKAKTFSSKRQIHKIIISKTNVHNKDFYYKTLNNIRIFTENNLSLNNLIDFIIEYDYITDEAIKNCNDMFLCGCMGPKGDEPLCRCSMKTVFKIENTWFSIYQDKNKIYIKPIVKNTKHNLLFTIGVLDGKYVLTN